MVSYFQDLPAHWIYYATYTSAGDKYDTSITFSGQFSAQRTQAVSGKLATQEWVLEQIAALQARIAALESNQ